MQSLIFRVSWELQFDDWAGSAGQSAFVELCIETIIVRCGGNCCLCHRRLPDQAKTPLEFAGCNILGASVRSAPTFHSNPPTIVANL
jgi:hypothetical protein